MSKLTHALTFDEVTNNFEVFSIDKFYNLKQPTSKNDFTIYSNYLINSGKNCMLEVEIVELGDMESLKKSLQNISSAIISHGLVQFVNGDDLAVIPLSNIEEFKNYVPQYKQRFHKSKIYRGKRNNKTDYQDIRIHGLGEHAEMLKAFEVLNAQSKLLTHALIRFIKDDSLQVVNINEIIEFGRIKPKTYVDYEKYTPYKIKINDDVKLIQILKLSNFEECAAYIDIFNELTHALVRCITKDETCVTMLHNIKEFQQDKPDHARDFKQDTLYTLEDQSGRNYIAVQIYSLGHETLLQYNLINAKRFKKTKFNRSDIKSVENAALSDSEDLSPHEDECNEESNNESDNDSNESPTKKIMDGDLESANVTHAAVRFYSDENKKVCVVPVNDILYFDRTKCEHEPYNVKRYSHDNKNFHYSPAEVLSSGTLDDLQNNKRYIFKKIRLSDAINIIKSRSPTTNELPRKNTKITQAKLKKEAKKENGRNEMEKFLSNRKKIDFNSMTDGQNSQFRGSQFNSTEIIDRSGASDVHENRKTVLDENRKTDKIKSNSQAFKGKQRVGQKVAAIYSDDSSDDESINYHNSDDDQPTNVVKDKVDETRKNASMDSEPHGFKGKQRVRQKVAAIFSDDSSDDESINYHNSVDDQPTNVVKDKVDETRKNAPMDSEPHGFKDKEGVRQKVAAIYSDDRCDEENLNYCSSDDDHQPTNVVKIQFVETRKHIPRDSEHQESQCHSTETSEKMDDDIRASEAEENDRNKAGDKSKRSDKIKSNAPAFKGKQRVGQKVAAIYSDDSSDDEGINYHNSDDDQPKNVVKDKVDETRKNAPMDSEPHAFKGKQRVGQKVAAIYSDDSSDDESINYHNSDDDQPTNDVKDKLMQTRKHVPRDSEPLQNTAGLSNDNRPATPVDPSDIPSSSNIGQALPTAQNLEQDQSIVETPRGRRRRRVKKLTLYAPKTRGNTDNQQNVYDNSFKTEVRNIQERNRNRRKLYEIENEEIYIGSGKMIPEAFWEFINSRGPYVFLRELLVILWGEKNLVNRCFKVGKVTTEIIERSPRKEFTPKKYKLLRRLFKGYLEKKFEDPYKKRRLLKNMNKHIGYKIRDLRTLRYNKINK